MGPRWYLSYADGEATPLLHVATCRFARARARGSRLRAKGIGKLRVRMWFGFDSEARARRYAAVSKTVPRPCGACLGTPGTR